MSDSLAPTATQDVSDSSFKAQFEFDKPDQTRIIEINGHSFACIGNSKSRWAEVSDEWNSGFLCQDGDITIVNPDRSAPIAYLNIMKHQYLNYMRGVFQNTQQSSILLSVFPRDPTTLTQEGSREFADIIQKEIPDAAFLRDANGNWINLRSSFLPHTSFIQQELGVNAQVADSGLAIHHLCASMICEPVGLGQLLASSTLSEDASIRDGFRQLLAPLLDNANQLPKPIRNTDQLLQHDETPKLIAK